MLIGEFFKKSSKRFLVFNQGRKVVRNGNLPIQNIGALENYEIGKINGNRKTICREKP